MGPELTLPALLVVLTLWVLHHLRVLNRLSFLELNRRHPLRDLITSWRAHRAGEVVRANRPRPAPRLEQPTYRGRHRHRGPVVLDRLDLPTPPLRHAQSRTCPRRPLQSATRGGLAPRGIATAQKKVDRNPVRPRGRHSSAA